MRAATLFLALLPLPAFAQCPGGTEIFSCQAGKKIIEVCTRNGAVTYSYGAKATPDLTLSVPIIDADYTPWPGFSRSLWSGMAFNNAGYTYEVWASFDRLEEAAEWEGGINVLKGADRQAQILCNKGSVTGDLSDLIDAKASVGQCWSTDSFDWQACP